MNVIVKIIKKVTFTVNIQTSTGDRNFKNLKKKKLKCIIADSGKNNENIHVS